MQQSDLVCCGVLQPYLIHFVMQSLCKNCTTWDHYCGEIVQNTLGVFCNYDAPLIFEYYKSTRIIILIKAIPPVECKAVALPSDFSWLSLLKSPPPCDTDQYKQYHSNCGNCKVADTYYWL